MDETKFSVNGSDGELAVIHLSLLLLGVYADQEHQLTSPASASL
jgi:hypothetical protein